MKASELRIRNLVYRCNWKGDKYISQIDGYDFWHNELKEDIRHQVEWNSLSPIPLTEEWLLKFGCEKVKSDIPTFSIVYGEFIEDDYEHCLIINLDVDNNFYIVIKGVKLILKYVHQLQNLYFALTGEELTIKNRKL